MAEIHTVNVQLLLGHFTSYIHQMGSYSPYWETMYSRTRIPGLKTVATVFPNTDWPRLVNNITIFFIKDQRNSRKKTRKLKAHCSPDKILYTLNI